MTEKAQQALTLLARFVSNGGRISGDWGFGTATLHFTDGSHCHIGHDDSSTTDDDKMRQFANDIIIALKASKEATPQTTAERQAPPAATGLYRGYVQV